MGRQFCVAAAEREDAVRFIVRADEKSWRRFWNWNRRFGTKLSQKNVKTESDQNNWNEPVPVISQRFGESLMRMDSIRDHAPYKQESIQDADQHK